MLEDEPIRNKVVFGSSKDLEPIKRRPRRSDRLKHINRGQLGRYMALPTEPPNPSSPRLNKTT